MNLTPTPADDDIEDLLGYLRESRGFDLLLSRNTLMYFDAETQERVLNRFHFALVPRGVSSSARPRCCLAATGCSSRST